MDTPNALTGANPPFEVIRHDPLYTMFLTDKGKICREKTKIPRPVDVADTSVPIVTWNGVAVNPPKDSYRTPDETNATTAWRKAVAEFERENATRKRKQDNIHDASAEVKKRKRENEKVARAEQRVEDSKLVLWLVFGAVKYKTTDQETGLEVIESKPRFGPQPGDDPDDADLDVRVRAFRECCTVITAAQLWDAYAKDGATIFKPRDDESTDESDQDMGVPCSEDERGVLEIYARTPEPPANARELTPEFEQWYKETTHLHAYDYDEHAYTRFHWHAVCQEAPLDINVFCKVKSPTRKATLCDMMEALRIGHDHCDDPTTYIRPQVSLAKSAFPAARYLAFGFCNDQHKTHADCDKTPLFGGADIDIEEKYLEDWLLYEIEWAGAREMGDLYPKERNADGSRKVGHRTWFSSIRCRARITIKKFETLRDAILVPPAGEDAVATTPTIRRAKLFQYADEPFEERGMSRLYEICAYHNIHPETLQSHIIQQLSGDRTQQEGASWTKKHLAFVGQSGCGKSAFAGPLVGSERQTESLLKTMDLPESKSTKKWAAFAYRIDTDVLMAKELERLLGIGTRGQAPMDQIELTGLWNCTLAWSELADPWRRFNFVDSLPIIGLCQETPRPSADPDSITNRLDIIDFKGGPLPDISCKGRWWISRPVMSHFLKYPIAQTMPEWFMPLAQRFAVVIERRRILLCRTLPETETEKAKHLAAMTNVLRNMRPEVFEVDAAQKANEAVTVSLFSPSEIAALMASEPDAEFADIPIE